MTTALMVLGAVALVLVFVLVAHQCFTSPLMWVMHTCNNTLGLVLEGLVWCVAGAWKAATGSD